MLRDQEQQEYPESKGEVHTPFFSVTPELMALVGQLPSGDALTYGATPLNQVVTLEQQYHTRLDLRKGVFLLPDGVPLAIASYATHTFDNRFFGRGSANNENFFSALRFTEIESFDDETRKMIERGELGHASPGELILIRDLLGIRSVELACLTHPYGENIDPYLTDMRKSVRKAVVLLGGEWHQDPTPVFSVKESVDEFGEVQNLNELDVPSGILMTRKRDLATLPDGSMIRERSSFVVRTDKDSELYKLLGPEAMKQLSEIQNLPSDQAALQFALFEPFIKELLDNDKWTEAIPISTTIYDFNKETERLVELALEQVKADRKRYFDEHNPSISGIPTTPEEDEAELQKYKELDEIRSGVLSTFSDGAVSLALHALDRTHKL